LKQSAVKFDNYEIVVWGKVVKDIKDSEDLFDFITKHIDKNIKVSVCAVAMDKLGVNQKDLPKGAEVVADAYVRIFELQALGYNVLIP
jgi:intracellular sulfur oxidation DsrE/DsrF family protein